MLIKLHMLGMCILDLSKALIVMITINITVQLAYEIETKDLHKDINHDVEILSDTSDYPKDHPCKM